MELVDGVYEEQVDDAAEVASALTASGGPLKPPKSWFDDPKLDKPTPIQVTKEGRIYGHIADWSTSHVGLPGDRKVPRSSTNYAFFRTGVVETEDGSEVPVGQLTLSGGHATLQADAGQTVKHYDDTASAVADIAVGEDSHGVWISGGLRPGVQDTDIRVLRASAPSGDWRPINGKLELVAVCQVNVPGFPVARAMVASGEVTALVAAGAGAMMQRRYENATLERVDELAAKLTRFEDKIASMTAAATKTKAPKMPPKKIVLSKEEESALDAEEAELMKNYREMPAKRK